MNNNDLFIQYKNRYRVAVLDTGLFSFIDVQHKTWPIIVVTNPKPLFTFQPCKEPVELMSTSTHIRIFIFSPSPITICEVLRFIILVFSIFFYKRFLCWSAGEAG